MTSGAQTARRRRKRQALPRPAPCITSSELDRLPHGPRVVLPWPARELSPNARPGWRRFAMAKKAYRHVTGFEAMAAGFHRLRKAVKGRAEVALRFDFYPPPNVGTYDRDNLHASMKSAQDGLADALDVDDAVFRADYNHHRERRSCVVVTVMIPEARGDAV